MHETYAIEAVGLQKSFSALPVLRGIDLHVANGSVFALLGPNGAGKTTLVRILATLTRASAGQARVAGFDVRRAPHQVRRHISLTGQYAAVDQMQTGVENLRMLGELAGLTRSSARARAGDLLAQFDLIDAGARRVATYSGGMRRRLDLAASLMGHPTVIFLDEPTTGLDPRSRKVIWEMITGLRASGVTVFLTTQYLDEADALANQIAVLDAGHVVAEGTAAELKQKVADQRLDVTFVDAASYVAAERLLGERAVVHEASERRLGVATNGNAPQVRALLDELDPDGRTIRHFTIHTATLDDVFFALTGHTKQYPHEENTHV